MTPEPRFARIAAMIGDPTRARMLAALGGVQVEGVKTNAAFLSRVIDHPAFRAGETHTGFVAEHGAALTKG